MKKLSCLLLSFALLASVNAAGIQFVKNMSWKQILQLAKQQNKMIFLDAYASWCGPCKYMERDIYPQDEVGAYYNGNFINVMMDMEAGEGITLSEEFGITAYPTFLFISASGKVLHKSVGAMEADEFIALGKEAKNPATQYYTLKQKVVNQRVTDKEFAAWAATAKRLSDPDLSKLVGVFLNGKKDILANEFTAEVALKYADSLTDAQLHYLVKSEKRISELLGISAKEASEKIYNKLFQVGVRAYNKQKKLEDFEAIFRKFDASRLNLASMDLRLRIALYVDEDNAAAAALLLKFIALPQNSLSLRDAAGLLLGFSDDFLADGYQKLRDGLEAFAVPAAQKGQEGWLYFMQAVCYYKLEETEKGKAAAAKAVASDSLDEEYKLILRSVFDL
ncbi:MAG TPA: thioredoxin fold domain-containing protein [Chitinophagaceae bacterium]